MRISCEKNFNKKDIQTLAFVSQNWYSDRMQLVRQLLLPKAMINSNYQANPSELHHHFKSLLNSLKPSKNQTSYYISIQASNAALASLRANKANFQSDSKCRFLFFNSTKISGNKVMNFLTGSLVSKVFTVKSLAV